MKSHGKVKKVGIVRRKVQGTELVDLSYDLTKVKEPKIPTGLKGKIVRVNIVCNRSQFSLAYEMITRGIQKQKPLLIFRGNVVFKNEKKREGRIVISTKLTPEKLIEAFIKQAPEKLRVRIQKEALEIYVKVEK